MGRSRSDDSDVEIDCHLYQGQHFDTDLGRWVLGLAVSMVNARSTGTVSITTSDPTELPRVEHHHYSEGGDLRRICDGIELGMEIMYSSALAGVLEGEGRNRWTWDSRKEFEGVVRGQTQTTNHCSGTAKMGPDSDPLAVTDQSGHVYGAQNLVVADSSLFPTCPRGNIHFPVVAVAEKIAAGLV
jgi:choline dehydrogenase